MSAEHVQAIKHAAAAVVIGVVGRPSKAEYANDSTVRLSASLEKGRIDLVEIRSQAGGPCRLQNPWPGKTLTLYRNGKPAENLSGPLLEFPTTRDEVITVVPEGSTPSARKIP